MTGMSTLEARAPEVTAEWRRLDARTIGVTALWGSGRAQEAVLSLDPLPGAGAEVLRATLVRRQDTGDEELIARIGPRCARFGTMSFAMPMLGFGALGTTYEALDVLGFRADTVLIPELLRRLGEMDLPPVILLGALTLLLVGVIGTVGWYLEVWWDFRPVRESHGALRASRGRLVARSTTLENGRLCGVEIAEPLAQRFGGDSRTYAVAAGTGGVEEEATSFSTKDVLMGEGLMFAEEAAPGLLGSFLVRSPRALGPYVVRPSGLREPFVVWPPGWSAPGTGDADHRPG